MSKKFQEIQIKDKEEGLEIIEATLDEIDLLTRAFDLISAVCLEEDETDMDFEPADVRLVVH